MYFNKEAIILAGGFGTRLRDTIGDIPKPMADINGRPFLEYLLEYLEQYLFNRVILAVGYRKEMIMSYFGDNFKGMSISYSVEDEPLGTGGAIKKAMELAKTPLVFVFNGDTMFRVDIRKMTDFHRARESKFTLALREVMDCTRYGSVELEWDRSIIRFREKGDFEGFDTKGFINGGIYLINKTWFEGLKLPDKFSFEKDFLEPTVQSSKVYGMVCRQYFIDIGIPDDYERAKFEFAEGIF